MKKNKLGPPDAYTLHRRAGAGRRNGPAAQKRARSFRARPVEKELAVARAREHGLIVHGHHGREALGDGGHLKVLAAAKQQCETARRMLPLAPASAYKYML
jgi:hypothetical protein